MKLVITAAITAACKILKRKRDYRAPSRTESVQYCSLHSGPRQGRQSRRSPSVPISYCGKHWEVNAWSIYSRFSLLSERRNWTTVHPGLEIENDVRELKSSHKELA